MVKLNIGIDIDDVQADFMRELIKYSNKKLKRDFRYEDLSTYHFGRGYNLSDSEAEKLIEEFSSLYMEDLPLIEGTERALRILSEKGDLHSLTARFQRHSTMTLNWLNKKLRNPYRTVNFCYNHFEPRNGVLRKSEVAINLGLDYMFEDSVPNAREIAGVGVKVILFRRPWNMEIVDEDNITVCNNWDEAVAIVN